MIQTNEDIVLRFFEAINFLILTKKMRGFATFPRQYAIDRRNFAKLKESPSSGIFKVVWLSYLVQDYGISAYWLLTGEGALLQKANS